MSLRVRQVLANNGHCVLFKTGSTAVIFNSVGVVADCDLNTLHPLSLNTSRALSTKRFWRFLEYVWEVFGGYLEVCLVIVYW